MTRNLIALLTRRGYALNRTADFETVRQIKEKLCYVSYDLELDKRLSEDTTVLVESYTLPDGRVIRVGSSASKLPSACSSRTWSTASSRASPSSCSTPSRAPMSTSAPRSFKAIVLSGGSSMYPGLPSRLEKELKQLWLTRVLGGNPERLGKFKVRIEDPPREGAHGIPRRCGPGEYHGGEREHVDYQAGVGGTRLWGAGEAGAEVDFAVFVAEGSERLLLRAQWKTTWDGYFYEKIMKKIV